MTLAQYLIVCKIWVGVKIFLSVWHDAIKFVFPSVFSLIETTCAKIRSESRPKIAKSPSSLSQAISVRCSNSSSVFLIMWWLFNNPNQEPITLSIFGEVLNTQSARSSSFACWFFGVGRRQADLLPKGRSHWRRIIKWIQNWKSHVNFSFSICIILIEIQMDKNHTEGEGPSSVFLFNDQVFVHLRPLQFIRHFGAEIR